MLASEFISEWEKQHAGSRQFPVAAIGAVVPIAVGVGDLVVSVTVRDVKTSWNQVRLLVTPVAGSGETWVELSRLRATVEKKVETPFERLQFLSR